MPLMMEYRFYRLTFGYRENLVSRDYKALPLYLIITSNKLVLVKQKEQNTAKSFSYVPIKNTN